MMTRILIFVFALCLSQSVFSQSPSQDLDSKEMNESMEKAFSEFQTIMDTLDFSTFFNQDFNQLFGEGFGEGFDIQGLDSLTQGFDMQQFFNGDISKLFGESMPGDMDMNQFNDLLGESMKMLEQMDMSELQKMMESFDFNMEGFDKIMPQENSKNKDKKKGLKKI